jgi:hypothetical protein
MELEYIQLTFGIAAAIFGLSMKTKNISSSIVYKVIPFFGGQATLIISLMQLGIL